MLANILGSGKKTISAGWFEPWCFNMHLVPKFIHQVAKYGTKQGILKPFYLSVMKCRQFKLRKFELSLGGLTPPTKNKKTKKHLVLPTD